MGSGNGADLYSLTRRAGAAELDSGGGFADHQFELYYYDHLGSIQAITHIAADPNEVNDGWDNVGNRMVYSYDA